MHDGGNRTHQCGFDHPSMGKIDGRNRGGGQLIGWTLDQIPKPTRGNVFTTFSGGGGSSMGYKLAGFDVVGCLEIDPKMFATYCKNMKPRHPFNISIQEFNQIPNDQLPPELFQLEILDGSPPCSSFSSAGNREKDWGKSRKFREGQTNQVLDELFFHWIDTVDKLKPKIAVAENVKGLIHGSARKYVAEIFKRLRSVGYETQLFVLNASRMGVPQTRERTFFIARHPNTPKIKLEFNEPVITVKQAWADLPPQTAEPLSDHTFRLWRNAAPGESMRRVNNGNGFTNQKFPYDAPALTVCASGGKYHPLEPRNMSDGEYKRLGSFPDDYDFNDERASYVVGMSVPPRMTQRVAEQIYLQMLTK